MTKQMQNFLRSIHLEEPERFDLDFDLIGRDPIRPGGWIFEIVKDEPWEASLLEEFVSALSSIQYRYVIHFSYRRAPSPQDAAALFAPWHQSVYRAPCPVKVEAASSCLKISFPDEASQKKYAKDIEEFTKFLDWLNYPSQVVEAASASKDDLFHEIAGDVPSQKEEEPAQEEPAEELIPEEKPTQEASVQEEVSASEAQAIEPPLPEAPKPIEPARPVSAPVNPEEEAEREEEEEQPSAPEEAGKEEKQEDPEYLAAQQEILRRLQENEAAMLQARQERAERRRVFHRGDYLPMTHIRDIFKAGLVNVDFEGVVFSAESKTTRSGRLLLKLGVHDEDSAIDCRAFEGKSMSAETIHSIHIGDRLRLRGAVEADKFSGETEVLLHYVDALPKKEGRKDTYEGKKRVELHLHTKMSQMDGVGEMGDYIRRASNFGMTALAVTDHGDLQSFPDAESENKALKKAGKTPLKILYGCELYMFDWPRPTFGGRSDEPLEKAAYCVLDFETTGLSHTYDRPIEFGAVLVEHGMVTKRIDLLINPGMHISEAAARINHIDDSMVKDSPKMEEAIHQIDDFIGDAILVTHNAPFDIGFLNMMRRSAGEEDVTNPVIDTLAVAQYLFPEAGRLNESALISRLKIAKDDGAFHRANYDAEQLSHLWLSMIPLLIQKAGGERGYRVSDLANLHTDSQDFYKHSKTWHVVAIVKNQAGLKDLYKIVSESETTYLAAQSGTNPPTPKVPRDFLAKMRGNLLLGSACFNGLVFEKARNGTQEELEEEMRFYDYIEVQPKENYSWLIGMGEIDEKRLDEVLHRIIDTAKKLGLPVCATGDCHYVDPEQKIARDVYISAKGLGGTVHPLQRGRAGKDRPYLDFPNPDQHFHSTQEMMDSFRTWLPEEKCREIVIDNTNWVADQVSPDVRILKDKLYTPDANLPGSAEKLRALCYENLHKAYGPSPDPQVVARLERELKGIIDNGYSVTYWIAHLLVKHAAEDSDNPEHMGYFIGSRGSVGSSFAATMAGITEVNPLPPHYVCPKCHHFEWANEDPKFKTLRSGFDLPHKKCPSCGTEMLRNGQSIPFETFLGFNADKVPDIDLNFPNDYKDRGHDYTRELLSTPEENAMYARGEFVHSPHVIRAGTISSSEEKNAYGYAKGYLQRQMAIKAGNGAKPEEMEIPKDENAWIGYLATLCTGVKRTTGQHPGGIVVIPADMDIFDFTPFQFPADDPKSGWLTTHFEFKNMHDSVLKLDELGHMDPVALRSMCIETGIDIRKVDETVHVDDEKVLSLFTSPKALGLKSNPMHFTTGAVGLPEFGTPFVQGLLEEAKPRTFNDLLIISGLSHGTDVWNSNAEDLIVKNHLTLNDVVGCRDDIMNYLISMGMDPSLSFHIMEDVRHGHGKFQAKADTYIPAMRAAKVPEWYIESCKKIQYLFPRAHAAAYVIAALRVAWFKIYRPLAYYATYFTTRCEKVELEVMTGDFNRLLERAVYLQQHQKDEDFSASDADLVTSSQIAVEMRDRGYAIKTVDLNRSKVNDWVIDEANGCLIAPFKAIPGFPEATAIGIVKAAKEGPFHSIQDLQRRVAREKATMSEDPATLEAAPFANVGGSALDKLRKVHALDGLSETDQMSLFDFLG